jgi:hypothetical protein
MLDQLDAAIDTAFTELLRSDTPDPGELRVGVTSLQPLLDVAGAARVKEFCTLLAAKTRMWKGMAHVQYPGPATDETVTSIARHVDARIDLRTGPEGTVEWRWHTGDQAIDSSRSWTAV